MENMTKGKMYLMDFFFNLVHLVGVIVNIIRALQVERDYRNQKSNRSAKD